MSDTDMDWEYMLERMQSAMKALDETHEAKNNFTENATPETFDAFKNQMDELSNHLNNIKKMLDNEGVYVEEEMIDIFKKMGHSQPSGYRRIPHLKDDDKDK
jgi:hypothetical protein